MNRIQEVGHCDLISATDDFQFNNFQNHGLTNALKNQSNIPSHSGEKKLILMVLLFFVLRPSLVLDHAEFYHSEALQSGNAASQIRGCSCFK